MEQKVIYNYNQEQLSEIRKEEKDINKIKKIKLLIKSFAAIFGIILAFIPFYNQNIKYPQDKHAKQFLEKYSKVYTSVVNSKDMSNPESLDVSELEKYIIAPKYMEDGKSHLNAVKDHIINGKMGNLYAYDTDKYYYEIIFNYENFIPSTLNNNREDKLIISGTTIKKYDKSLIKDKNIEKALINKPQNDGKKVEYDLLIDKNTKNIKIKKKNEIS